MGRAGIDAKFGGTMLVELQDLVSRVHLQRVGGSGAKTPRDDRASRLQFTGTVLGSFGFTLEEAQASLFPSRLSEAIEASLVLFDAAATDDETFIEAIADSDPRVLGALKKMVEGMYKAGATVRFITPEKEVALDKRRVEAAWERTGRVEVDQEVLWLQGIFLGVLGDSRRFEFAIENGDVIGGRVLPTLDSETLAGWNARYFRQRCAAQVVSVTSRTAGKSVQKHTLITLAERIPDTTEEPGPEATPAAESARPRGRS
ncbi:MAG: hypothetical protein HOW73_00800 [Polyangiaceae bacterium]|nr:hypothetical protein [Polyangiaceae bacterium]